MTEQDMGGFAFPNSISGGMALWDYYAAAALTGFTSASDSEGGWTGDIPRAATEAALIADAMLAERRKRVE